ncbi:MAG: hypothetical protein ACRDH8_03600 [Actinomycetota bacterium]
MRADFFRPEDPKAIVGSAVWDGTRAVVESEDDEVRSILRRVFRPSPLAADDPATRASGTSGVTVAGPGDLEWFRLAARVRGEQEGLGVRFVTEQPGGWDPALDPATYGWAGRKPALPRER